MLFKQGSTLGNKSTDSQIAPSFLVLGVVDGRSKEISIYGPKHGLLFCIRDDGRAFGNHL